MSQKEYFYIVYHNQQIPFIMRNKESDSGVNKNDFKIIDENSIEYFDGWNICIGKLNREYFNDMASAYNHFMNKCIISEVDRNSKSIEESLSFLKKYDRLLSQISSGEYKNELYKIKEREGYVYFIDTDSNSVPYIKQTNNYKFDAENDTYEDLDGYSNSYPSSYVAKSQVKAVDMLIKEILSKVKKYHKEINKSYIVDYFEVINKLTNYVLSNEKTLSYDEINIKVKEWI